MNMDNIEKSFDKLEKHLANFQSNTVVRTAKLFKSAVKTIRESEVFDDLSPQYICEMIDKLADSIIESYEKKGE